MVGLCQYMRDMKIKTIERIYFHNSNQTISMIWRLWFVLGRHTSCHTQHNLFRLDTSLSKWLLTQGVGWTLRRTTTLIPLLGHEGNQEDTPVGTLNGTCFVWTLLCQKDFRHKESVEPFVKPRLWYHCWVMRGTQKTSHSLLHSTEPASLEHSLPKRLSTQGAGWTLCQTTTLIPMLGHEGSPGDHPHLGLNTLCQKDIRHKQPIESRFWYHSWGHEGCPGDHRIQAE